MKKYILLSLLSLSVFIGSAQVNLPPNLDTVYGRNVAMQAQDWAVLVGAFTADDSLETVVLRRIRDRVRASANSFTTSVTVDSIPGRILLEFYRLAKQAPAGTIAPRYTAITGAINGKANMQPYTSVIDTVMNNEYLRVRNRGKNIIMDN